MESCQTQMVNHMVHHLETARSLVTFGLVVTMVFSRCFYTHLVFIFADFDGHFRILLFWSAIFKCRFFVGLIWMFS